MNSLQVVSASTSRTPIEVLLQVGDDETVSLRSVYEFLELNQSNYSRWCKVNLEDNEFAEDGVDYWGSSCRKNGNLTMDYKLSIPFAKKLCMLSKTERGEQARDYFIKVEDTLKRVARNLPQLTQNEMILQLAQANVELERKQAALEERVDYTEQLLLETGCKFDKAMQTFAAPRPVSWTADMNAKINALAADNGLSPVKLKGDLYAELERDATVCLSSRRKRLQARLKKQGATYRERQAVTKLDVIGRDKPLRVIFESIVKKYQAIQAQN